MDVDKEFPTGSRVKHRESGKIGTVQAAFDGPASLYEPWEVPVQWHGDKDQSVILFEDLERA